MSIYNYLGGPLAKKTIFNKYFNAKTSKSLTRKFGGLCILYDWLYIDKLGLKAQPQRFQVHSCGNDPMRALIFGPMLLGFTGSSFIGLFTLWWIPFGSEPYPLTLLFLVLIGNLTFLNLQPLWDRMAPPKLAYFDRQTGKVGYTFGIPGCDERMK